ncbi:hypothetical protein EON73_00330 [bacterium]|nr:MAG: hypothetical protein EON73_00330 [bacterium]
MGGSLKELTAKVRRDRESSQSTLENDSAEINNNIGDSEVTEVPIMFSPPSNQEVTLLALPRIDLSELIENISSLQVSGKTRITLRIDNKQFSILNKLKPAFNINVNQFINFLIKDFMDKNPEFKDQIKNSIKNSIKEI